MDNRIMNGLERFSLAGKVAQSDTNHEANLMLTICGLRNVYVWERMALGRREELIASTAWDILQDWRKKQNHQ